MPGGLAQAFDPAGKRGGELSVDQKAYSGDVHDLVVQSLGGIFERGADVLVLQTRVVLELFLDDLYLPPADRGYPIPVS